MASLITRCMNCQGDLHDVAGTQCEKCLKNEDKYGKPTNCMYCKLPAAFTEDKCVYCCYSERKHGAPIACAHCKSKSAFNRHPKKPTLCRLCIIHARSQGKHELSGVALPKEKSGEGRRSEGGRHSSQKPSTSGGHGSSKKRASEGPSKREEAPVKQPKLDLDSAPNIASQTVVQIQSLQAKVDEFQKIVLAKDRLLLEKDRQIAQLKANVSSAERKYRDMVAQLNKEKEEAVQSVHARYKEVSRQERLEKQERERNALREKERKEREKKLKKEKERKEAEAQSKREKSEEREEKMEKQDKENDSPRPMEKTEGKEEVEEGDESSSPKEEKSQAELTEPVENGKGSANSSPRDDSMEIDEKEDVGEE